MQINGILIDSARLAEKPSYYFELLEHLQSWGLNTLLLHFSDDHGLAVALPGFEELAHPNALSADTVRELVREARERGIDLIPELETFGHTRFLTDHPRYADLATVPTGFRNTFQALDPLSPKTRTLVRELLQATVSLFDSHYLHIGCDEVELGHYCEGRGLEPAQVWAEYVNWVFGEVRALGKEPMFWGDHCSSLAGAAEHKHAQGSQAIRARLDKEAVLVDWRYDTASMDPTLTPRLKQAGFERIVLAPALVCWLDRFTPGQRAIENTAQMCRFAAEHDCLGVINTIWVPHRYTQGVELYGIAYSAECARAGGALELADFHRQFADKTFGETGRILDFLAVWNELELPEPIATALIEASCHNQACVLKPSELEACQQLLERLAPWQDFLEHYHPPQGNKTWRAMRLGVLAWQALAEHALLLSGQLKEAQSIRERLETLIDTYAQAWDEGRYSEHANKWQPHFPAEASSSALQILSACLRQQVEHASLQAACENTDPINRYETNDAMGKAAAAKAAHCLREAIRKRGQANVILATGLSQSSLLENLLTETVDWSRVHAFHLDEYAGLAAKHPASFRRYLRERFQAHCPKLASFEWIRGDAEDPAAECERLNRLAANRLFDLACVGIGENSHLAFNDPPADFQACEPYIQVTLDEACRAQQLGEGWFPTLDDVPKQALSMSIRQILRSRTIICTVPDTRKAQAVKHCLEGPISPEHPASILRRHPDSHYFLDEAAASLLSRVPEASTLASPG